ncbi:hypothetical protein ACR9YC_12770 [Parasphingorhabdus sp. DH2-15]|uniref:hypothetical protein n=1 Tax=Parasphingorhabdus sp. DH2-15 TaxID=3444112 RepID=UPI003F6851F2
MKDQFNIAALATLSKTELLALLANLQSQLNVSTSDAEHACIKARLNKISHALTLK